MEGKQRGNSICVFMPKVMEVFKNFDLEMSAAHFFGTKTFNTTLVFSFPHTLQPHVLNYQLLLLHYYTCPQEHCSQVMFCSCEAQHWQWYSHHQEYPHSKFNLDVSRVFYSIGHKPTMSFVRFQVQTDPGGYILIIPRMTQTSVKGVFATGDGTDRQCVAVIEVEKQFVDEEEFLVTTRKV